MTIPKNWKEAIYDVMTRKTQWRMERLKLDTPEFSPITIWLHIKNGWSGFKTRGKTPCRTISSILTNDYHSKRDIFGDGKIYNVGRRKVLDGDAGRKIFYYHLKEKENKEHIKEEAEEKSKFKKNDRVKVREPNWNKFYEGKIVKVRWNKSPILIRYDVELDDKKYAVVKRIKSRFIKLIEEEEEEKSKGIDWDQFSEEEQDVFKSLMKIQIVAFKIKTLNSVIRKMEKVGPLNMSFKDDIIN